LKRINSSIFVVLCLPRLALYLNMAKVIRHH